MHHRGAASSVLAKGAEVEQLMSAEDPCPSWCRVTHGVQQGEEDALHLGVAVYVRGTPVRLCMTGGRGSTGSDGPYVLVGEHEYTLDEAQALSGALAHLVDVGSRLTPRAGAGRRSRGR